MIVNAASSPVMSEASDNIENIFLCGLGFFFNPSPFFMCRVCLCRVCLTQIPQISLNFSFDGVKSHGGWWIGRGACPCALISKAHTDFKNNFGNL